MHPVAVGALDGGPECGKQQRASIRLPIA